MLLLMIKIPPAWFFWTSVMTCMSVAPTLGIVERTVFIDAWHGGVSQINNDVLAGTSVSADADSIMRTEMQREPQLRRWGYFEIVER
jgi:hypothetical protein